MGRGHLFHAHPHRVQEPRAVHRPAKVGGDRRLQGRTGEGAALAVPRGEQPGWAIMNSEDCLMLIPIVDSVLKYVNPANGQSKCTTYGTVTVDVQYK